jgi:hypothetical protein
VLLVSQPVVPLFTQHAIVRRAPLVAYVPARGPIGYRYARWTYSDGALHIWFRNRGQKQVVFTAAKQRAPGCAAGKQKTFQMGGNKVYWKQTAADQEAWRCVGGVRLTVATTQAPTRFADVGLGRVAASVHRIRR